MVEMCCYRERTSRKSGLPCICRVGQLGPASLRRVLHDVIKTVIEIPITFSSISVAYKNKTPITM